VGNCLVCHPAPVFTDFRLHNTGAAQEEYDAIHGSGAFALLAIPDLRARQADAEAFLPSSPRHPQALGPFLSVPAAARPGDTDLGVWNTFANPAVPDPQERLRGTLCDAQPKTACTLSALLDKAIARFKTAGLRDLGHSAPYLHTGRFDSLEDVVRFYARFSALARAGAMRNPDPALSGIGLQSGDIAALAAFLAALNEDYE
jgi:cytochrome c peroxidase